jgi:hypothetical protein
MSHRLELRRGRSHPRSARPLCRPVSMQEIQPISRLAFLAHPNMKANILNRVDRGTAIE